MEKTSFLIFNKNSIYKKNFFNIYIINVIKKKKKKKKKIIKKKKKKIKKKKKKKKKKTYLKNVHF